MGTRRTTASGGKGGRAQARPIARRTGRTAKRLPNAVAAARRLTQDEFVTDARFTEDQVGMLDRIANGRPPRNALAIVKAMELKAGFAYQKPKQQLDVTVRTHAELVAEAARRAAEAKAGSAS